MAKKQSPKRVGRAPKAVLRFPDLDQAKSAVLNSLSSVDAQRRYRHAIDELIEWYCSEPRISFSKTVVLRYRIHLEGRRLAPGTVNLRLEVVRRLAYEAADYGLMSAGLAAGIRRVKGLKKLWVRVGNWLTSEHDVGCGNGRITDEIAGRVPDGTVVGVDSSSQLIAFADRHFGRAVRPNLRFAFADARLLPFRDEFNLVVSFNALHWIPKPGQEEALRSVRAAMEPDAAEHLRLVPAGRRKSLENVIEETRLSSRWELYFHGFRDPYLHLTPEQYVAAAERNGLGVRRVSTHDKVRDFLSRSAFLAFGSTTSVEWTQHVPEAKRLEFVTDVLDRYRAEVADGPGEENTFKFQSRPAPSFTAQRLGGVD